MHWTRPIETNVMGSKKALAVNVAHCKCRGEGLVHCRDPGQLLSARLWGTADAGHAEETDLRRDRRYS